MRVLLIVVISSLITACASNAPRARNEQGCYYNSKTVVSKKNGKTLNEVTEEEMDCSDDPVAHLTIKKLGIAPNCGIVKDYMTLNGKVKEYRYIACQKLDGGWEVPNER